MVWRIEGGRGKREKEEKIFCQKPRERNKMGNEIFLGPIYLNTPLLCNYQNALVLSVYNPTLILNPY
jgi:hypothetical protein